MGHDYKSGLVHGAALLLFVEISACVLANMYLALVAARVI